MMEGSCHGDLWDCKGPNCCKTNGFMCFEKNATFAACRPSCAADKPYLQEGDVNADGLPWTCRQPFAHQLAQARQTYRWPHITAVCSAGEALVDSAAFYGEYNSSCTEFCMRGAGRVVMPELSQYWIGTDCPGCGEPGSCEHDTCDHAYTGIRCACSFPDRL